MNNSIDQKRILHKMDSESKTSSYFNKTKLKNKSRMSAVANGMPDLDNIGFLYVTGKSQLEKEINETKNIDNKILDRKALHRNEITGELENFDEDQCIIKNCEDDSNSSYNSIDEIRNIDISKMLQKGISKEYQKVKNFGKHVDEIIYEQIDKTELL